MSWKTWWDCEFSLFYNPSIFRLCLCLWLFSFISSVPSWDERVVYGGRRTFLIHWPCSEVRIKLLSPWFFFFNLFSAIRWNFSPESLRIPFFPAHRSPASSDISFCTTAGDQFGHWVCGLVLSRSVMSDSLWSHGLEPTRLLYPWDFPGKRTGVGCHCLLQGIFLTQGSNLCLLHWHAGSFPLSHLGSPSMNTTHGIIKRHFYVYHQLSQFHSGMEEESWSSSPPRWNFWQLLLLSPMTFTSTC